VQANLLALENSRGDGKALNIGSGDPVTICEIADALARALDVQVPAEITGKCRAGDVRHCFADISQASRLLDYRPRMSLRQGVEELVSWLGSQPAKDSVDQAIQQLNVHGLVA
jgi:dTDP-L-rhamnose 4-epimerase